MVWDYGSLVHSSHLNEESVVSDPRILTESSHLNEDPEGVHTQNTPFLTRLNEKHVGSDTRQNTPILGHFRTPNLDTFGKVRSTLEVLKNGVFGVHTKTLKTHPFLSQIWTLLLLINPNEHESRGARKGVFLACFFVQFIATFLDPVFGHF